MTADFEWDDEKRQSNIEKHGVDFVEAVAIFGGPVIEAADRRSDYGEERFRALGRVDNEQYVVAYTRRGENRRILSAWRLDEDGKRRYSAILAR